MDTLTDLEICTKVAEIEGMEVVVMNGTEVIDRKLFATCEQIHTYNPLKDDALCFQLMVKYEMPPMKCKSLYDCYYELDEDLILSGGGFVSDKNPNRAICLAIIEAHKENSNG